ncbi:STAS-like domain-containing protein [Celeribacter halophilus]|uniref:STAS-like domain-containing protein n=1 Tax=Celeribacter halophilus TaxID=576117 RepID=A0AAW7Y1R2_9RHOB|nr:STAS-like domain-containing protein [Celeribacter halophilus]MDO6458964.1 STAS-like domain-containing protein [Celeribacter halophilus]MDO6724714.1 STAS-like domain-containing protein [Celeribacter halophilus]
MAEISIATDFSRFPGGRYRKLGKHSGEEFREDVLSPALKKNEEVFVILDGTVGYGSSFLEEAFGGLVRIGFSLDELKGKLKPVAQSPEYQTYVQEIWQYIEDASQRKSIA